MAKDIVNPTTPDSQSARDWLDNLGWNRINVGDKVWHGGWDQLLLVKRVNKRKYGVSLSIEAIGPGDNMRVGDREIIDGGTLYKPTEAELQTEISLDKYNDCPHCHKGHIAYVVSAFSKRLEPGKGRCDACGYNGLPSDAPAIAPATTGANPADEWRQQVREAFPTLAPATPPAPAVDATCTLCGSKNTVNIGGDNYGCHNCGEEFHPNKPHTRYNLNYDSNGNLDVEEIEIPIHPAATIAASQPAVRGADASVYAVTTDNMDDDCHFDTIQDALDFIGDQLEMGYKCSVREVRNATR